MPKRRAVEVPEDFTDVAKIENKFKLSLMNMEKRFVELEMVISELSERLKSGQIEPIKALNQRIEGIEALMLVEQAGLNELKKMIAHADKKFQATIELDQRLESRLEEKLKGKIEEGVEHKLAVVENKMADVKKSLVSIEELAKTTAEKAERPSELPDEDKERISLIEKEIAELKTSSPGESISPLEIGELRTRMKELEAQTAVSGQLVSDLKNSIDGKIKTALKEVQYGTAGFEFMNSKLESLKAGIDMLGDKRIEMDMKLSGLEEKISLLERRGKDSLPDNLLDEVKTSKRELSTNKVKIESLERVVRELNTHMQKMEDTAKRFESLERLTNLKKDVDEKLRRFKFLEEGMSKLSDRVEFMYNDLDKRLMSIKNQRKDIEHLSNNISDLIKTIEEIRVDMKNRVKRKDMEKELLAVEDRIGYELARIKSQGAKWKKEELERGKEKELPKDFKRTVDDLNARLSETEKALETIQSSVSGFSQREAQSPSAYDAHLKELVNKLVFLESRLAAMESTAQKPRPVVLE